VGDQVLKMLAGQLDKTGGSARAYRYGGEEFVLVFEGKPLAKIEQHLEDLRARVARYPMKVRDINRPKDSKKGKSKRQKRTISGPLKVTISIGAAQRNEKIKTVSEVMNAADKALYKAKNAGRNRVITSD
jgi:diguanylate cyclase (GGDEF)-like protein